MVLLLLAAAAAAAVTWVVWAALGPVPALIVVAMALLAGYWLFMGRRGE